VVALRFHFAYSPILAFGGKMEEKHITLVSLPTLVGRVAVLGGTAGDKTALLVGLALRQVRQHGSVICLDARRQKQTEVQFRLLLRADASYFALSPGEGVPHEIARTVLSTASRALEAGAVPAFLLLIDSFRADQEWERTLLFLLNAGVTVVELLPAATDLLFGRYDTVLLLRTEEETASVVSRAVGRKVSDTDLLTLRAGQGILIHLARTHWVTLPEAL
jgi:hypothetical protein